MAIRNFCGWFGGWMPVCLSGTGTGFCMDRLGLKRLPPDTSVAVALANCSIVKLL